jgi:hypothetical protein
MLPNELESRLDTILAMIDEYLKNDMLVSTRNLLLNMRAIASVEREEKEAECSEESSEPQRKETPKIVISTGSHENYTCRLTTVAWIVEWPSKQPQTYRKEVPLEVENADYDVIYEALVSFFNTMVDPGMSVEICNDNQLTICHLNNEVERLEDKLINKRNNILEVVKHLPVDISFTWRPKNSTKAMKLVHEMVGGVEGSNA